MFYSTINLLNMVRNLSSLGSSKEWSVFQILLGVSAALTSPGTSFTEEDDGVRWIFKARWNVYNFRVLVMVSTVKK